MGCCDVNLSLKCGLLPLPRPASWALGSKSVLKLKNTEIVVFDLELDLINSLANKHGLGELSRDMPAPEFHRRVNKIVRAARLEEMTLPEAVPSKFGPRKRSDLD